MSENLNAQYLRLLRMVRECIDLEMRFQGKYALAWGEEAAVKPVRPDRTTPEITLPVSNTGTTPSQPMSPMASSPETSASVTPPTESPQVTAPPHSQSVGGDVHMTYGDGESAEQLRQLCRKALQCTKCKLAQHRNQVVFGAGVVPSDLVIIGEGPGYHEDQQGIPFVGKAGELLTKMLQAIDLRRDQIYICNVVKCRPPKNRDPEPDEIKACEPWLMQQLSLLDAKVILAMGKFASAFVTGVEQPMSRYRGAVYSYRGISVVCTYHPAYLLRNPEEKRKSWQDLLKVKSMLEAFNGSWE